VEIEENLVESPFKSPAPPYLVPSAPVTPNNPPWTAFTAIGVWIVSVFLILMIPGLFLLPYLAAQSSQITDTNEIIEFAKTDTIAVLIQIAAILPAHLLTLAVVWLIATRFRKFKLRDTLGFDKGGFAWWHYLVILGGFFVIAAVVGAFFPEQENDLVRILKSSRWAVYFVAFVATFTAPVV
jgi:H+/Cl- antiporter ClcA